MIDSQLPYDLLQQGTGTFYTPLITGIPGQNPGIMGFFELKEQLPPAKYPIYQYSPGLFSRHHAQIPTHARSSSDPLINSLTLCCKIYMIDYQ
jgi:hypothetical protein